MSESIEEYKNLTSLNKDKLLEKALELKGILIQKQHEIDLSHHLINVLTKLDAVSEDLRNLKMELSDVKRNNKSLKKKVYALEDYAEECDVKIFNLEKRMNKIEQYTRRENIEISGISDQVQHNELDKTVVDLLALMNVNISTNDIEACHKLPDKQNPYNVIVRFTNRKIAIDCFRKKKLLKEHHDPVVNSCFVSENLSPAMKEIMDECKALQHDNLITSVWSFNGIIKIKFNNGFEVNTRKIFHLNDLDFLYNSEDNNKDCSDTEVININ